jgi:hypothetical protein
MKTPTYAPIGRMTPRYLADFDTTSAMMMALGNYLRNEDVSSGGAFPPLDWLSGELKKLNRQTRETIFAWSGFMLALHPEDIDKVRSEQISKWVVNNYRKKSYPAIAIGSSNGAMTYLQSALGIPWLPQTFLIPVRRPSEINIDEPLLTMKWARDPARILLKNNPDLQLHHMYDPNHDRIMLEYMTYFRVKKLHLGTNYERFITDVLPPGGTLFVSECQHKWPTTKVDNRHVFQFGGMGGATGKEYSEGSSRVEKFLDQNGSPFKKWNAPDPDGESAEAEWGFEPALYEDIERIAREGNYKIKRIVFDEPDHPSPFVAELYKWWYEQRRIISKRMIIGTSTHLEPYWMLRTGSVPFWLKSNMEPSAKWLDEYLKSNEYDELFLMLLSQGVEPVGQAPMERWESILAKGRKRGEFLKSDNERIPMDLGSYIRNNPDIRNTVKSRYPIPGPLGLNKFLEFIEGSEGKFKIKFIDYRPQDIKTMAAGARDKQTGSAAQTRPSSPRNKAGKARGSQNQAKSAKTAGKPTGGPVKGKGKQAEPAKAAARPAGETAGTGTQGGSEKRDQGA